MTVLAPSSFLRRVLLLDGASSGLLAVIATNGAWVLGSFLLLLVPGIAPSGLGYAVVIGQALAVAVLAEMEYVGLRRSAPLRA